MRTHVYALAYKAEMFYTFDSTQSRNESGSERFKNKKGIFHSNNGGYLHFDVIVSVHTVQICSSYLGYSANLKTGRKYFGSGLAENNRAT